MMDLDPNGGFMDTIVKILSTGVHYIWFICIAILGGTANYIGKVQRNEVPRFSIAELLGEWTISGFVALLTALLCNEYKISYELTAVLCGITGHMGGRAVFIFEIFLRKKFQTLTGSEPKD